MPRVVTKTKSTRGEQVYRCTKCGEQIVAGQQYYQWGRMMGGRGVTYRRHTACGYPKPSELSSRKTAQIEDILPEIGVRVGNWGLDLADVMGGSIDTDWAEHSDDAPAVEPNIEELRDIMGEVADVAEEVGQEYQDGYDAMPEGLNQGSTAQAMQDVASELEDWASNLRDYEPSDDLELPAPGEFVEKDEWIDACEAALNDWADNVRGEAEDLLGQMPEYQG